MAVRVGERAVWDGGSHGLGLGWTGIAIARKRGAAAGWRIASMLCFCARSSRTNAHCSIDIECWTLNA